MTELWPGGPIELPHAFSVDDVEMTLPEIPVRDQLWWLASGNWPALYPSSVLGAAAEPILRRFVDDDDDGMDYEHLWECATLLFGHLAGLATPEDGESGWWPAMRLASTALYAWPQYSAWCAEHGADPLGGPLWRVIATIYSWLRVGAQNPDALQRFERELWAPPPEPRARPGVAAAEVPEAVREREAAMALASLNQLLPGEQIEAEWTP